MSTARGVSRRSLLTGAVGLAGVAVGAGGAELSSALAGSSRDVGPHVPSPGEELMIEHGVLKRLLLGYQNIHERLITGQAVPNDALTDSAQIISDYVESFHEGLEEGYVFPRVAHHEPALIATLLTQHDRGRHLTAAIHTAATGDLTSGRSRRRLADYLAAYVRMYEPHEAWEDTVVYPTLREVTTQRTLDELAERFAHLENQQYGDDALATILQRVAGIEERLGIHDLNAFTPRGVP